LGDQGSWGAHRADVRSCTGGGKPVRNEKNTGLFSRIQKSTILGLGPDGPADLEGHGRHPEKRAALDPAEEKPPVSISFGVYNQSVRRRSKSKATFLENLLKNTCITKLRPQCRRLFDGSGLLPETKSSPNGSKKKSSFEKSC
jgi:hypothetical protein